MKIISSFLYINAALMILPACAFAQAEPGGPMVNGAPVERPAQDQAAEIQHEKDVAAVPAASLHKYSIFFTDSDLDAIRSARLAYESNVRGANSGNTAQDEDFLKKLEKATASKLDSPSSNLFTYPQFFLSSIAYYSANNWVVWINDEKITQDSGETVSGIRIVGISNDKISVEWRPARMDKIVENIEETPNNPVHVDMIRNKVGFYIKPNQTFSSYAMQVVEGKVLPVTVNDGAGIPLVPKK